jgi:uncharacterized protein (TIGR02301 family)
MSRAAHLIVAVLLLISGSALAQDQAPSDDPAASEDPAVPSELPPPIYEDSLLRLAEILGALTFLRDLCAEADSAVWRNEMSALLDAERPGPQRRARLVARFNHGFETFHAVYRSCTPSAKLSVERYLSEGQALASDVRSRYSQ